MMCIVNYFRCSLKVYNELQVLIDKRNIAESLLFERLGILEFLETQYIFFFSFIRFRDIGIAISFLMEF